MLGDKCSIDCIIPKKDQSYGEFQASILVGPFNVRTKRMSSFAFRDPSVLNARDRQECDF
jgi:hypothetical protein